MLICSIFNSNVSAALTSNLGNQGDQIEQFHLIFEDVGQMASSVTYVFSTMTINVSEVEQTINHQIDGIASIISSTRALPSNHPNSFLLKEKHTDNMLIHMGDLRIQQNRMKSIRSKLPKQTETPKVKGAKQERSLVNILFGTLGTFMSLFTNSQYKTLQKKLENTDNIQKRMIEVVNNQGIEIQKIRTSLDEFQGQLDEQILLNPAHLDAALESNNRKIKVEVDTIFRALQAAQYRRLAMDFLDEHQTEELFQILQATAKEANSDLLITQASDLFQLELSYFFNGESITFLLHVPMVLKGSLLNLVKLHPFPLPIAGDYSIVPDVENQLLALSTDGSRLSMQFAATSLMSCHATNHVYLCENQGVLNKALNQSCLGALYDQNIQTARTLCPMKIIHAEEVVYKLKDNINLVYTPFQQVVPIRCPLRSYDQHLQIGVTEFQILPGCTADYRHHLVLADNTITLEGGITHIAMPRKAEMGIPNVSKEQLTKELDIMKQSGLYRPTVNELIENHEDNNIIQNLKNEIENLKTLEQTIIENFKKDIIQLQSTIKHSADQMTQKEDKLKELTIEIDNDINNLETSSTPLTYSIVNWSICIFLFIIILISLYYFYKNYHYQLNILYEAFKVKTLTEIRPILLKFFQNNNPEQTENRSNTPISNISPA